MFQNKNRHCNNPKGRRRGGGWGGGGMPVVRGKLTLDSIISNNCIHRETKRKKRKKKQPQKCRETTGNVTYLGKFQRQPTSADSTLASSGPTICYVFDKSQLGTGRNQSKHGIEYQRKTVYTQLQTLRSLHSLRILFNFLLMGLKIMI